MSEQNPADIPATVEQAEAPENPGSFKAGYDPRRMGNRGGGRPKREIIERARQSYADRIRILEEVADGKPQPFVKRLQVKGALVSRDPLTRMAAERAVGEAKAQGIEPDPADFVEIRWEESPSTELRVEVIEKLAKMGHMHVPMTPKESEDPTTPDVQPVYTIAFD